MVINFVLGISRREQPFFATQYLLRDSATRKLFYKIRIPFNAIANLVHVSNHVVIIPSDLCLEFRFTYKCCLSFGDNTTFIQYMLFSLTGFIVTRLRKVRQIVFIDTGSSCFSTSPEFDDICRQYS